MPILLNGTAHAPPGIARVYAGAVLVYQAGSGGGGSGPYQPNANGNLVFEAEAYDASTPGSLGEAWMLIEPDDYAGLGVSGPFSGDAAMACLPDAGTSWTAGDPNAPVISYEVDIPSAGTWHLYFYAEAPNTSGNEIYLRCGGGSWESSTLGTAAQWRSVSLTLAAGVQTVEIQADEDGAVIDRFVLATTSGLSSGTLDAEPNSVRS